MKTTLKPSATATKRLPIRRNPWAAKPGTEEARILTFLKSVGARPSTRAEIARLKKIGAWGMPNE